MPLNQTKVKWFQVLLRITNNSIKHQSFVYRQLNDQTVPFQTIQFNISIPFFVYTQLNLKTVLFQSIQFSMSTKLNDFKYSYVSLTIQLNII